MKVKSRPEIKKNLDGMIRQRLEIIMEQEKDLVAYAPGAFPLDRYKEVRLLENGIRILEWVLKETH